MEQTVEFGQMALTLVRKPIKHLHISVLPPIGKVRVSAPEKMTDTAIRMAVIKRIPWIRKQQQSFEQQPRESAREMVSGETHYLWGRRYRLEVLERTGKHEVCLKGKNKMQLFVSPGTSLANRQKVVDAYYREQLKVELPGLVKKWQLKIGVELADIRIQKMKTKWGSCAVENRRILLNAYLAQKPSACLEYILVHEMVHLLERHHNAHFIALMDQFLPNWRETRNLLKSLPISE